MIGTKILDAMNDHMKEEVEDVKRSNLRGKLSELPSQIREYFFQEITISKVLDVLREVKSINSSTTVIKYIYSVPVVDILPEDEEREHTSFSYKVMNLNYYECIDLLELMITYLSDDDESTYNVQEQRFFTASQWHKEG